MKNIVVVGSLNMDLVVRTARLPTPGQTIRGQAFQTIPGGKGANQAVAASRLAGAETTVHMVGRVGKDTFGDTLRQSLGDAGVNTDEGRGTDAPTGTAMIAVEESGENFIIIAPGATGTLTPGDMDAIAPLLREADALLLQLETPLAVVERAAALAAEGGATVLLNPAPGEPLPVSMLRHISFLIPNETEAVALADESDPVAAARILRGLSKKTVILTMGERGALIVRETQKSRFSPSLSHP